MMNESAKGEVKASGKDVQETEKKSILLAVQLSKLIFKAIKKDSSLKKDLKVKIDEPTNLKIYVGNELQYQGKEGLSPEINKLNPEQLETIKKALETKVGDSIGEKKNITIAVNNRPIFKMKDGVVQQNDLQSELVRELSQNKEPLKTDQPLTEEAKKPVSEVKKEPDTMATSEQTRVAISRKSVGDLRAGYRDTPVMLEPSESGAFLVDKEGNLSIDSQKIFSQEKQDSVSFLFDQSKVKDPRKLETQTPGKVQQQADGTWQLTQKGSVKDREATVSKTANNQKTASVSTEPSAFEQQKTVKISTSHHEPTPTTTQKQAPVSTKQSASQTQNPPKISTTKEKTATSSGQTLSQNEATTSHQPTDISTEESALEVQKGLKSEKEPQTQVDSEALQQHGIDPKVVTEAVEKGRTQQPNNMAPVIVIVNQDNQLAQASEQAPKNFNRNVLQKVGDFIKEKTAPISKAVNGFVRPFRNQRDRQNDLKGLVVLLTSKQLLQEFGQQQTQNRQFSTGNYHFVEQKDSSITVSDPNRGVLLNYDGTAGKVVTNKLEGGDHKVFSEIKKELEQYKANASTTQREHSRQEIEVGD